MKKGEIMGQIYDTTYTPTPYNLISQTPPNMPANNYYLYSLQEKINADWNYRSNRVDIEQEMNFGEEDYSPIEVVIQSVRNDKGTKVSDDIRRLVFKDVKYEVSLGTRFRFSYQFDIDQPDEEKDVWISTNRDSASPTSQVVVTRCNGTLGSIYQDSNGVSQYHYEPVICTTNLSTVSLYYNDVIVTPQAQVMLIVQHNQYTKNYNLNQRFILGYDKVYKVKAINKFNSLTTYNPYDIGTILLYAELDEISEKDDFENRIAFNSNDTPPVITPLPSVEDYSLQITKPVPLPTQLFSTPIQFEGYLFQGTEQTTVPVDFTVTLEGTASPQNYYQLTNIGANSCTLQRLKVYTKSPLILTCSVSTENSPIGQAFTQEVSLNLGGLE